MCHTHAPKHRSPILRADRAAPEGRMGADRAIIDIRYFPTGHIALSGGPASDYSAIMIGSHFLST